MATANLSIATQNMFDVVDEKAQRVIEGYGALHNRFSDFVNAKELLAGSLVDFNQELASLFSNMSNGNSHLDPTAAALRSQAAKKAAVTRANGNGHHNVNGNGRGRSNMAEVAKNGWKTRRDNAVRKQASERLRELGSRDNVDRFPTQEAIEAALMCVMPAKLSREEIFTIVADQTGRHLNTNTFGTAILSLIKKGNVKRHGRPRSHNMTYSYR